MSNRIFTTALLSLCALTAVAQQTEIKTTYLADGSVKKDMYRSHTSIESISANTTVAYACNGVELILTQVNMNKTSGASIGDNFRKTGCNSVLTATTGSNVIIENCEVNTHVEKSDGITVIGEGTKAKVQEGTIILSRNNSMGISAIDGGTISVEGTRFNTVGTQCSPFYTDGGSITATAATGGTSGAASPLFKTAGTQKAVKCRMNTEKSNIAYVDAGGDLILEENELKGNGYCGIQMYSSGQEMGRSRVEITKNKLSVPEGPLIMASNTNAEILFKPGNLVTMKSDDLLIAKALEWGVKGSNGGHVNLTTEKQNLKGNIVVDSISSVVLNLKSATYIGTVNADANPCAVIRLVIDRNSGWQVTGDSYITSLKFDEATSLDKALKQMKGKFTVYYDASDPDNSLFQGKEHAIPGGGKLVPKK